MEVQAPSSSVQADATRSGSLAVDEHEIRELPRARRTCSPGVRALRNRARGRARVVEHVDGGCARRATDWLVPSLPIASRLWLWPVFARATAWRGDATYTSMTCRRHPTRDVQGHGGAPARLAPRGGTKARMRSAALDSGTGTERLTASALPSHGLAIYRITSRGGLVSRADGKGPRCAPVGTWNDAKQNNRSAMDNTRRC